MAEDDEQIRADFPFTGRYATVYRSRIHYYELGAGQPVVFLHGNPTWGYLWRNVVPYVAERARCIVPDLIGMGRSDKPDAGYRFFEHYAYVAGFIEALGLENVVLVGHDWGSALAFHYFHEESDNVRGLAFMEAILGPLSWAGFPPAFRLGFRLMRTPGTGWVFVSVLNGFVEHILPRGVVRTLSRTEMAYYREPYPTVASRRAVRQWPREIPLDGRPGDVAAAAADYGAALQQSPIPKLLLYARPGGIIGPSQLDWCRRLLPALETVDVGSGIHYLQEDNPRAIGEAIAAWLDGT